MSLAENKALVGRETTAWNTGNLDVIDEIYAPGFIDQFTGEDCAALKQKIMLVRAGFSNVTVTIDDQIAEGELVVSRWTARGIHEHEFMGAPATHKPMAQTGISIRRVVDGKIVEGWMRADDMGLLHQVGLLPAAMPH